MTATAARRDGDAPFTLAHTFAAPRARVWRAWTDPAELKQWFGPAGYTLPTCRMDLRPGGTFHYCMRSPDGKDMWGKWTFREIAAPERLAIVTSFSDAQGGITRHPMAPTWPQETLAVTTFTEEVGSAHGHALLGPRWHRGGAPDLRRRARRHASGLGRHHRPARSVPGARVSA